MVSGGEFLGLRHTGFRARVALTNHDPEAMDVSRQNRQRHVAFESVNSVIRAQVQPKILQTIDRRFHRRMFVPSLDKSRLRFSLAVRDRQTAFLGHSHQIQLLFQSLSIRRTVETLVETDYPQAGKAGLACGDHAHRHLVVGLLFHDLVVKNETVLVFENAYPQSQFNRDTCLAFDDP